MACLVAVKGGALRGRNTPCTRHCFSFCPQLSTPTSNLRFEFPLELDMFPYTAEGLAAADAAKAAEEQQQQQQEEQPAGQQQPSQRPPVRTSSSGGGAAAGAAAVPSNPAYTYDLYGVVVHCGSAFTGHYYSYIRERPGSSAEIGGGSSGSSSGSGSEPPRWYCFDDKDVTAWDIYNLEADCYGGRASQDSGRVRQRGPEVERAHSAYMLFYERRLVSPDSQPAAGASSGDATGAATAATANGGTSNQQQQEQPDVDMALSPASSAAAAPSADVSAQQQQQLQQPQPAAAAASSNGGTPGFSIPYGMPVGLYKEVMEQNIHIMWLQHVFDRDYFRFVRQLVDSRGDLGQLTTRKARRRDGGAVPASSTPAPSGSGSRMQLDAGPATAMAAAAVAGSCPPQQQQQQQQHGHQPAPLDLSPAGLQHASTPDLQASPGPSSRRGEDAEAVAQALMRLGVLFQFQVHLRAAEALRSEHSVWYEALTSLMGSGPSSSTCMQVRGRIRLGMGLSACLELTGWVGGWVNV